MHGAFAESPPARAPQLKLLVYICLGHFPWKVHRNALGRCSWHNSPSLSLFGAFGSGICPPSARYPLHGAQEFRVEQAGTIPSRCSPDAWMDAPRTTKTRITKLYALMRAYATALERFWHWDCYRMLPSQTAHNRA